MRIRLSIRNLPMIALAITVAAVLVLPYCLISEINETFGQEHGEKIGNYWIHPPTWQYCLFFGTYKQENLLYVVMKAASITLTISFFSLAISLAGGILLIWADFQRVFRSFVHPFLRYAVYFPRLFFLILLSVLLKLQETSKHSLSPSQWLVLAMGFTGALFLAAQTSEDISNLKQALFVHFAQSLGLSSTVIFARHVLRNCITFPISVVKQLRDNILFVSVLTFIGLIHLHPEDLGSLICKLYNDPEAFYRGWWILFFPCAFLFWLIFLLDLIAERISDSMERDVENGKETL